ncbi:hypothetical protein V491_02462, partial [Pseudogymnoascus sp. VKM F-3775]
MTIIHIVLFEFAADADPKAVNDICKRMLNLSNTCRHPENGQQYVFNGTGGKNNSPEGLDGGLTHAFISHFVSEEDRKYYLEKDPVHLARNSDNGSEEAASRREERGTGTRLVVARAVARAGAGAGAGAGVGTRAGAGAGGGARATLAVDGGL